jgi:alpha-galactosidase
MNSRLFALIALLAAALPSQAGIHTFSDFTRPANAASLTETFDFVPNEGWSGTPANAISGEASVYLKVTVSWAAASNIGTFSARFNVNDDAGAPRWSIGSDGSGFGFLTGNGTTDPDGAGPATAKPTVVAFDKTANTSVTLVLKVNQLKASPGGDWWFGDAVTPGAQDGAGGFMWINPNLAAAESSQPTPWAAWRSSNNSYQGVSFTTDTAGVDLNFSNIAIYTGDDTPFATSTGIVDAATSTVSASPTAVPADGTATSTISVTLKDSGNSPAAGKEVSLSGNGSATIETINNTTNAGGVASFTVKSNTVGTEQFTATDVTDGNLVITQTASVNFQTPVVIGPVSAANSTVVTSAASVLANGISTTTITVTLRDSNGLLITNEGVSLSGSPSGAPISPAGPQTTNGSGQALFSVKSTTIGPVAFTATSATNNVTISQTANVNFTDPLLAQAFNVNFLDDGQANATGLVGVVGSPGETWNQGTTSVSNLVDTTGTVVSSAAVVLTGAGDGRTIGGGAQGVFTANRNAGGKGGDSTISITGLTPDTAYDIHIYSLSHGSWGDISNTERAAGNFVTTHTVLGNGQSQWLDNGKTGTNGISFVPNGNYVSFQSIVSNGSGSISIVGDAHDGIDGLPGTDDANTRLHICGLQIRPASGASVDYAAWRNASYPGLGLPDLDDDGDGLSNGYEHIFGLNPTRSASANPYPAPFGSDGYFSYSRRTQSLINMNYKVWVSTNLQEWFEDNAANQVAESVSNGVQIMGVEINPALLSEPKLFVQVRATPITGIDLEPALLNIRSSGNTITLIFSEPMNPASAANPNNYSVTQDGVGPLNITGATLNPGGGSVTLTLASALGINTAYTVGLAGVTSGTGQSLGVTNRPLRTWDNDPNGIKVFILAGQSNMVGRGESERGNGDVAGAIGSLRYQVVNDNANYGQLVVNSGNPATDPWVVRSDVKFWWNRADIGGGNNITKGGLQPQGLGSGAATFGPEYGFGWAVGENSTQPVLLIKTAWGGKDLITNFRPPGAVAARGGVVGAYYIDMLTKVRQILHNLEVEFPAAQHPEFAAVGYRYQIAGFGWHQGWNDGLNTLASNEYEANMANFITDVRAEFGKPNLPFSIGTTGMVGPTTSGNLLTVVNAQINVANPALHPELGGNVFTIDTRPFAETTENSPTNDTTHWKNNGKSMYRIGKGMGDGIVNLLP